MVTFCEGKLRCIFCYESTCIICQLFWGLHTETGFACILCCCSFPLPCENAKGKLECEKLSIFYSSVFMSFHHITTMNVLLEKDRHYMSDRNHVQYNWSGMNRGKAIKNRNNMLNQMSAKLRIAHPHLLVFRLCFDDSFFFFWNC